MKTQNSRVLGARTVGGKFKYSNIPSPAEDVYTHMRCIPTHILCIYVYAMYTIYVRVYRQRVSRTQLSVLMSLEYALAHIKYYV